MTTPFDFEKNKDVRTIAYNDVNQSGIGLKDEKYVFYLHGKSEKSHQDCIVLPSDYDSLYKEQHLPQLEHIKALLSIGYRVLFVGFSYTDPYVLKLLDKVKHINSPFDHPQYIIAHRNDGEALSKHGNLSVLAIDRYEELTPLLRKLLRYTKGFLKHRRDAIEYGIKFVNRLKILAISVLVLLTLVISWFAAQYYSRWSQWQEITKEGDVIEATEFQQKFPSYKPKLVSEYLMTNSPERLIQGNWIDLNNKERCFKSDGTCWAGTAGISSSYHIRYINSQWLLNIENFPIARVSYCNKDSIVYDYENGSITLKKTAP